MGRPPAREVWHFAARVAAWLAPCVAAWYLLAPAHARPVAWMAREIVGAGLGRRVTLEWQGALVAFVTDIALPAAGGREALLAVEVNPLVYTYGVALFAALALASRLPLSRALLGLALLLPFQAWGVAFDALVEIGVKGPFGAASAAGFSDLQRQLLPLAYQAGALLFPGLAPVAAWALLGGARGLLADTRTEGCEAAHGT